MRTKRNQRGVQRARVPLVLALRKVIPGMSENIWSSMFQPCCRSPSLFWRIFLSCSLWVLMKSGILRPEHLLPSRPLSLGRFMDSRCFFSARIFVFLPLPDRSSGILERKFPLWSVTMLNLSSGGVYGATIGLFLLLLLEPRNWLNAIFLLLIGMAVGQGNWYCYRKLTVVDASMNGQQPKGSLPS